jgi:hypothetical protein
MYSKPGILFLLAARMIGAAKKKNPSLLSLAFVRVLLLLVVTLFLPQTRVWG